MQEFLEIFSSVSKININNVTEIKEEVEFLILCHLVAKEYNIK